MVNFSPTPALFDYQLLQNLMEESSIDALVAHSGRHFFYLSGFASLDYVIDDQSKSFVLIPRGADRIPMTTFPTWEAMRLADVPCWVPLKVYAGNFYVKNGPPLDGPQVATVWEALVKIITDSELGDARVAFELDQLSVELYKKLILAFPRMEIVNASPLLHRLRMIKTPEEARRIQIACEITQAATDEGAFKYRPGMTERELAIKIAEGIISRGAEVLYVQVATGAAAGLHLPTDRQIKKGDIVRADVAAVYEGYNSDLGRTYVVGPPTNEQKRIYQTAYRALQAGIREVKVSKPAKEIFQAAMAVWADAGYPHVRRHHIGHGLGLEAHEAPIIRPDNSTQIEAGMVLAIEVPYYVYGLGGFAPEDVLLVNTDGTNTLFSNVSAELPVIGN